MGLAMRRTCGAEVEVPNELAEGPVEGIEQRQLFVFGSNDAVLRL